MDEKLALTRCFLRRYRSEWRRFLSLRFETASSSCVWCSSLSFSLAPVTKSILSTTQQRAMLKNSLYANNSSFACN